MNDPVTNPTPLPVSPEVAEARRQRWLFIRQRLLERLSERSTWSVLITLASTVLGIAFAPEQIELFISVALGIVSLIGILTVEAKEAVEGVATAATQAADPGVPVQAIGDPPAGEPPFPTAPPRGT